MLQRQKSLILSSSESGKSRELPLRTHRRECSLRDGGELWRSSYRTQQIVGAGLSIQIGRWKLGLFTCFRPGRGLLQQATFLFAVADSARCVLSRLLSHNNGWNWGDQVCLEPKVTMSQEGVFFPPTFFQLPWASNILHYSSHHHWIEPMLNALLLQIFQNERARMECEGVVREMTL